MGYFQWVNKKIKKLIWLDLKCIKWATAAFILMVAKLWAPLLSLNWYWYGLIGIIIAIRPMYQALKK